MGYVRAVVAANRENQIAFEQLQEEKTVMEAKLQSIEVVYITLKDQAQGLALELSFRKKALETFYNKVVPLRHELFEARASQVSLWGELTAIWAKLITTAKEKTQYSQTKLKALRDSRREFQEFFKGLATLTGMIEDKIFLVMSNLYFFNLSQEYMWISLRPSIQSHFLISKMYSQLGLL